MNWCRRLVMIHYSNKIDLVWWHHMSSMGNDRSNTHTPLPVTMSLLQDLGCVWNDFESISYIHTEIFLFPLGYYLQNKVTCMFGHRFISLDFYHCYIFAITVAALFKRFAGMSSHFAIYHFISRSLKTRISFTKWTHLSKLWQFQFPGRMSWTSYKLPLRIGSGDSGLHIITSSNVSSSNWHIGT